MRHCLTLPLAWKEPMAVLAGWRDLDFTLALISGGGVGGRSWLARDPDRTETFSAGDPRDPFAVLAEMLGQDVPAAPYAPVFSGGVMGLAAYSLGGRVEALDLGGDPDWPDLILLRFPALLAFDHDSRILVAIGRGDNVEQAESRAFQAAGWVGGEVSAPPQSALSSSLVAEDGADFEAAVAKVRERIAAGDIFQANIARRWKGRLARGVTPFDLFQRLASQSPAPYAAWLRLPGKAIVSNSPEQFVSVRREGEGRRVTTRPIKGTAPRGRNAKDDAAHAAWLAASAKDRAENLMIVDLMRNDLSRVCAPGSVATPELFRVESFPNVHHLVSTVPGDLRPEVSTADLLKATFPPGSITGAPKVQAMKVISELEPPRGPFFGSIFWAGFDGAFDSSVLIRTTAFVEDSGGWRFEARAGGGITADSDPVAERAETDDKIGAILRALTEPNA